MQFQRKSLSCLRKVLEEVQNMEQTLEVRIPEGSPGIRRVVSAWGQPVMRSKDWHGNSIQLSAGLLVWVLYVDEEETVRCVDGWIPFQLRWELPEGCPDGTMRMLCLPRYTDARSVSAGKLLIRAGLAALAEAWCSAETDIYNPEEIPEDAELLRSVYPVRMPREAGEKTFLLEESLSLPGSVPVPRQILCWYLEPEVTDTKVLADKVLFRGNGRLHILYEGEDGQLHGWDFELPFSQFAELGDIHSPDARSDIRLAVTNGELDLDGEGKLQLRSGLTAQYLIDDQTLVEVTEDAYSPMREVELRKEQLTLPSLLDSRRENLYGEQTLSGQAERVVDARLLPNFPRQSREGDMLTLDMPGLVQLLYYDGTGALQSATGRWEGGLTIPADPDSLLSVLPLPSAEVQAAPGETAMTVKTAVPVQLRFTAGKGIPMVTGLELGQPRTPDPGRPSLVIRRADRRLWDLAKSSGSTVDAIREANDLTGEPAPDRLLLIPIP